MYNLQTDMKTCVETRDRHQPETPKSFMRTPRICSNLVVKHHVRYLGVQGPLQTPCVSAVASIPGNWVKTIQYNLWTSN